METLNQLGVSKDTLTQAEKDFLDQNGYLNLGQLLSSLQVEKINDRIHSLMNSEGDNAGSELLDSPYIRHPKEAGADRLADLGKQRRSLRYFLHASSRAGWCGTRVRPLDKTFIA